MKKVVYIYSVILFAIIPVFSAAQSGEVSFSVERGVFNTSFLVELSYTDSDAYIYFTSDGSEPSAENGTLYNYPFFITSTSLVRAIAYSATDTSSVTTHSYIFPEDIFTQQGAPNGYSALWGTHEADYDVDTTITNNENYREMIVKSFEEFPVISLVSNKENLFNDTLGIYANSENEGVEWERPASIEMLRVDGIEGFQEDAGLRISGGSTRNPFFFKKHSFRLLFKSQYGAKKLEYPLFGDDGAEEFNTFNLRMIGHFNVHDWNQFRREKTQLGKDQFIRELQAAMGQPHVRGMFVHVFLNGMYWGIYNLTERPDAAYMSSYFGGDKEEYDAINSLHAVDGDSVAWYELHNLAEAGLTMDSAYTAVQGYLDVDNFFDYMILNHWGVNTDWDFHNWYVTRRREPGAPFRFFSWDAEFTLGYFNYEELVYDSGVSDYLFPRYLFHKLMENPTAKERFADRVECSCKGEGALTSISASNLYAEITENIKNISVAETARWGDVSGTLYSYDQHIVPSTTELVDLKIPNRANELVTLYQNKGVYPTVEGVIYSSYGGLLGASEVLWLFAPEDNGTVYYTMDGSDPRMEDGNMNPNAIEFAFTPIVLPAGVTDIKARVYTSDGEWSAMCPQRFYKEQNMEGIVINEIHYNADSLCSTTEPGELDYIEIVNVGSFEVDMTDAAFTKGIQYKFPYGTVIPPGEFYVIAENIDSFAFHYGFAPDAEYIGALSNGGDRIILKNAFGNLLDSVQYNDKTPWDVAPDGGGTSLELLNPEWDNSDPLNWFRSDTTCDGTPGAANSRQCQGLLEEIVINEINYNSLADNDPGDWVELYNPTGNTIDLSGWQFFDEKNNFTISENTLIAPDSYLVVAEDSTMFSAIFPNVDNYIGSFAFNLSGSGERLTLLANGNCLADYVIYDDNMPWDTIPDGNGPTLSLTNSLYDNTEHNNWESSSNIQASLGTPGRPNIPCPTVGNFVVPELCARESAVFTLDTLLEDMTYEWSFWNGEQNISIGDTIKVSWNEPGNYSVELVTKYHECTNVKFLPLQVNICNEKPLAQNDTIQMVENTEVNLDVRINDDDPDGDSLTVYNIVSMPSTGVLTELQPGFYRYKPPVDLTGTATFVYEVCDNAPYALCDTASVFMQVQASGDVLPIPIAFDDFYNITEDGILLEVALNNNYAVFSASNDASQNLINSTSNGVVNLNPDGTFNYIPENNFYGQDVFSYELCLGSNCDTAIVSVDVIPVNDAPIAVSDTFYLYNDSVIQTNIMYNDYDIDMDELFASLSPSSQIPEGYLSLETNGELTFIPGIEFDGIEEFTYSICDNGSPAMCSTGQLVFFVEMPCVNIELRTILEGAYDAETGLMSTKLNTLRKLLPGQTPLSVLVNPTPPGHPYNIAPWNYDGDEGANFNDADYNAGVVDWVLVSFRTGMDPSSTIARTAALLHSDGSIKMLNDCIFTRTDFQPLYIVIEHRNHIGIMSPEPVFLNGEELYYDFTLNNSYKDPTANGQKELSPGLWVMFGADGDQIQDMPSYDINGRDKSLWFESNGVFDVYNAADYNMDGDVNGGDKVIWYLNNGISSRVLRGF